MENSSLFEWHKWFKECCKYVEDDGRSGHPRSHRPNENIDKVGNQVNSDRPFSIIMWKY